MIARLVDLRAAEWQALPSLAGSDSQASRVRGGWWLRELKLPVSAEGQVCLDAHALYARLKYFRMFEELAAARAAACPMLSGGVLFPAAVPHWHFLMDGIASLPLGAVRERRRIYVDEELSAGQLDFLAQWVRVLGGGEPEIVRIAAQCYRLDDVLVPTSPPVASRVQELRRGAAALARERGWPDAPCNVTYFVTRNDAHSRRLLNEAPLIARLSQFMDIRTVAAGTLAIEQQVETFRRARGVIGAHGSGLTNAAFSPALEFIAEMYLSPQVFFAKVAESCGCAHVAVKGHSPQAMPGMASRDADFQVDVEKVAAELQRFA